MSFDFPSKTLKLSPRYRHINITSDAVYLKFDVIPENIIKQIH